MMIHFKLQLQLLAWKIILHSVSDLTHTFCMSEKHCILIVKVDIYRHITRICRVLNAKTLRVQPVVTCTHIYIYVYRDYLYAFLSMRGKNVTHLRIPYCTYLYNFAKSTVSVIVHIQQRYLTSISVCVTCVSVLYEINKKDTHTYTQKYIG